MLRSSSAKPCILLVEDSLLHADVLEACLRRFGAIVLGPFSTVQEALSILKWSRADAVIFNSELGGRETAVLLPALLDEWGIPSLIISWSPLAEHSPLRQGRVELVWPVSEGELFHSLRVLLAR